MNEFHIGQTVVPYEIEWSPDRSTIGLFLDSSMELTVKAPVDATTEDVREILDRKKEWLLDTLYGLAEQAEPPFDKEFLSGEKLLYNGRRYRLKVEEKDTNQPVLTFDGHRFLLQVSDEDAVSVRRKRQAVVDWYVQQAQEELPARVDQFAQKLGVEEVDISVNDLHRRWGEYDGRQVSLHWRLVFAPRRIQDYVAVHELAHSKHNLHTDAFWNTVGSLIPDYRDRREWLRVNGNQLTV